MLFKDLCLCSCVRPVCVVAHHTRSQLTLRVIFNSVSKEKNLLSARWPADLCKCSVISPISQVGLCQQVHPVGGAVSWWSDADRCFIHWGLGSDIYLQWRLGPIMCKKWAPLQLSRCYRSHSSDRHKLIKLTVLRNISRKYSMGGNALA